MRGATHTEHNSTKCHENFNPRAPCGARPGGRACNTPTFFISTHAPLAGRDLFHSRCFQMLPDFNPRAPCGARRRLTPYRSCIAMISTHAPLAGRDYKSAFQTYNRTCISTHAPLAGRDLLLLSNPRRILLFQPTRPLRGATVGQGGILSLSPYFNPRAPCGARL